MNIFVCGDSRGHHTAIVLRIDKNPDTEYPISLETGEMLTRDNCTKLAKGRFGNRFKHEYAKWRNLRTYRINAGSFDARTRASTLNKAL
ncbi:hypothetical protein PC123_g10500 [Phytophthora cactorum]|nr:hypothetical protein PC123_g10500 [Phytophthora cactorum]